MRSSRMNLTPNRPSSPSRIGAMPACVEEERSARVLRVVLSLSMLALLLGVLAADSIRSAGGGAPLLPSPAVRSLPGS